MSKKKETISLSDLKGVGPAVLEKLEGMGIVDLIGLIGTPIATLSEGTGMSDVSVRKLVKQARDLIDPGFMTGEEFAKHAERFFYITTGVKEFDAILGGGFRSGWLTECFGQFGSSKTQVAHQMSVNVQLPIDKGGQGENAVSVYLDSEGTFTPQRIHDMAVGKNLNPNRVMQNVRVAKAKNTDDLSFKIEKVVDLIVKDKVNVKLVVVDSLTAHFRAEFAGRGTLADRQQKLNRMMHMLMRLADEYNVVVYVTNQVMSKPDSFYGDPIEAIGGNIVGHNSAYRIYLRPGKAGSRVAKLVNSPDRADAACAFMVDGCGLMDL